MWDILSVRHGLAVATDIQGYFIKGQTLLDHLSI